MCLCLSVRMRARTARAARRGPPRASHKVTCAGGSMLRDRRLSSFSNLRWPSKARPSLSSRTTTSGTQGSSGNRDA